MLTSGRNITAETAFTIAVKSLFDYGRGLTQEQKDYIWKVCHESSDIQWATTNYLASSSKYAPIAFEKLKEMLRSFFDHGEEF